MGVCGCAVTQGPCTCSSRFLRAPSPPLCILPGSDASTPC